MNSKTIKPTLHLSDKVAVTPSVPVVKTDWSSPKDVLGNEIQLTIRPDRATRIKLGRKGDGFNLTVTKKF